MPERRLTRTREAYQQSLLRRPAHGEYSDYWCRCGRRIVILSGQEYWCDCGAFGGIEPALVKNGPPWAV